jgi:hypothetical protein
MGKLVVVVDTAGEYRVSTSLSNIRFCLASSRCMATQHSVEKLHAIDAVIMEHLF